MKKRTKIILGTGALGVAVIVGVSVASTGTNSPGYSTVTEKPAKKKAAKEDTGPFTSFKDGTFKVGTDIKAGSYKTNGKSGYDGPSDYCYWQRSSDDSGELDSIIANSVQKGPGRFSAKVGEYVTTSGSCTWKLVR